MNLLNHFYSTILLPISLIFNSYTSQLDFFAICLVYSILFIILHFFFIRKKKGWVAPQTKQLSFKETIILLLIRFVSKIPILSAIIKKKLQEEQIKLLKSFTEGLRKKQDPRKTLSLPQFGMTQQSLKNRIDQWMQKEKNLASSKKISGSLYVNDDEYSKELASFSKNYLYQNPLHLDSFRELLKLESEVLQMTGDLLSPHQRVYGSMTSGGTESLMLAVHTYKQYYKKERPNIIAPVSIHIGIDKACFYFNVECRKAKLNQNFEADIDDVKRLIDKNTILIVGSAPNYPHGIIDPLQKMAKLALENNIGMHVDACLGGFILAFAESLNINIPFNFKINGVTSISIDHHKYGLAPKGSSALFFKTKKLRQAQYFSYTNWCGGIYTTATICGSRSGVGGAGAWFAMVKNTFDGYKQNSRLIMETVVNVSEQLRKIKDVKIFGYPKISVFAFRATSISTYDLNQYLKQKKWSCSALQRPEGLHVTVTLANYEKLSKQFVRDVREGIEAIKNNPGKYKGESSAMYGLTQKMPDTNIKQTLIKVSLDAYLN